MCRLIAQISHPKLQRITKLPIVKDEFKFNYIVGLSINMSYSA